MTLSSPLLPELPPLVQNAQGPQVTTCPQMASEPLSTRSHRRRLTLMWLVSLRRWPRPRGSTWGVHRGRVGAGAAGAVGGDRVAERGEGLGQR